MASGGGAKLEVLPSQLVLVGIEVHQELDCPLVHLANPELHRDGAGYRGPSNLLLDEEQREDGLDVQKAVATVVTLHDRKIPIQKPGEFAMEASFALGCAGIQHEIVPTAILARPLR